MKKILLIITTIATLSYSALGVLIGERISGSSKACYYNINGSTATLTVGIYDMCPSTHDF